jgi:RimJ/RimL family protein N-acetyltransferase
MTMAHVDELVDAATDDRSTFTYAPVPWDRTTMTTYVGRALANRDDGTQYPFVTLSLGTGQVVGTTRFYGLEPWDWSLIRPGGEANQRHGRPDVAQIGYTWLHPAVQRTPVNTEAKLLMLTQAFDVWGVRAVRIQTDVRNDRSRRAIERLGCHFDGVLRAERPAADGTVRDTATFSMLADEWPANRQRLEVRLETA